MSSATDQPVPPVPEVLARLRTNPVWDEATICPADNEFPRVHAGWHAGHGFVIQCFEHDRSSGHFLVSGAGMSTPAVEINLGGQALERWPLELFVAEPLAHQALEGRAGRGAWERTHPRTGLDENQRP